jgi:hypothetical protein
MRTRRLLLPTLLVTAAFLSGMQALGPATAAAYLPDGCSEYLNCGGAENGGGEPDGGYWIDDDSGWVEGGGGIADGDALGNSDPGFGTGYGSGAGGSSDRSDSGAVQACCDETGCAETPITGKPMPCLGPYDDKPWDPSQGDGSPAKRCYDDGTGCPIPGQEAYHDSQSEMDDYHAKHCQFGLSPDCDTFCVGHWQQCDDNRDAQLSRERGRQEEDERREEKEAREYCKKRPRDPLCGGGSQGSGQGKGKRRHGTGGRIRRG